MTPGGLALLVGLGMSVSAGCASRTDDAPQPASSDPAPVEPALRDSMVLTTADGYSLWFTGGRSARDTTGEPCVERSLEIRRDSLRRTVPLLYTRSTPKALERGFVQAELSLDCRTIAVYRVELATGRPTKIEDR